MNDETKSLKYTSSILNDNQDFEDLSNFIRHSKKNHTMNFILESSTCSNEQTTSGFKAIDSLGHVFIDWKDKDFSPSVITESIIELLSIGNTRDLDVFFQEHNISFYSDENPFTLLQRVGKSNDGTFYLEVLKRLYKSGKTFEQLTINDYSFSEVANVWPQFFKINNIYYFIK